MLRALMGVGMALVVFPGAVRAEVVQGKVKSADPKAGILTVKIGDHEQQFKVTRDTRFLMRNGRIVDEGLRSGYFRKEGNAVEVTYEVKDGREEAQQVKLLYGMKQK